MFKKINYKGGDIFPSHRARSCDIHIHYSYNLCPIGKLLDLHEFRIRHDFESQRQEGLILWSYSTAHTLLQSGQWLHRRQKTARVTGQS